MSRTYVSQGLTLHYADWGNDGAPPLILVHGNRDHARSWDWIAGTLRDRWHVVAPDLRGHGDSAWSPEGAYLNPYHLLDFVELMDTLGHDKVTVVGHSFGAGVASRYAAIFPDRIAKLAIVDGFGPELQIYAGWAKTGPVPRTLEWVKQRCDPRNDTPRRFTTIDEAIARIAAGNSRLSEAQARHLTEHGVRRHADGYGWKFDPRVSMFAPEDFSFELTAYWREITAPTLLCYGAESWSTDPEKDGRAANLRNRRTIAIENAGHWPHHDQFDAFIRVLQDFL
ncbi:MAG: alpha/beta hydrolase [Rhodospirillaceae bacterium]|nr:MAG: alpha/beta hydrolase [Rhodospirillaceae bacterium]